MDEYLKLLTSQHRNKPKLAASITASIAPLIELNRQMLGFSALFDLETATGDQLLAIAKWVGAPTAIPNATPLPLFGFEGQSEALTFGETGDSAVGGFWRESGMTGYVATGIDLVLLRRLIKAQIYKNQCQCTFKDAGIILSLFMDDVFRIFDSGQMWVGIGVTSNMLPHAQQLIRTMFPRPMGVGLRFFNHWFDSFGWADQPDSLGFGDTTNSTVGGFWIEEIF